MINIKNIFKKNSSPDGEQIGLSREEPPAIQKEADPIKRPLVENLIQDEMRSGNPAVPGRLKKILSYMRIPFIRRPALLLIVLGLVLLFLAYFYFHVGTSYTVLSTTARNDISGTNYMDYGKNLIKLSPDGVSCVNYSGDTLWSTTFSMQTPIGDICDNAVVVADQKGTQIYIFDETGMIGKFQTLLPIEKVRVASQGVVLAVLEDGDTTWINFYDTDGNEIAKNRTTISESGYPLDVALSPDGLKVMVSYLNAAGGEMSSEVSFYNFDQVGKAEINNLVSSTSYKKEVAPKVHFIDEATAVAYRSDGFSVYTGKQIPEEKANVSFEEEILSIFYDKKYLGFVFDSGDSDHKYKIMLFDINGKKKLEKNIDYNYKQIKLSDNQIVIYNESEIAIYSINGRLKFECSYDKPITEVTGVRGVNKYFILTQDSTDLIRLK